ncbi:MAG: segregation and condensation protein A [Gammaproteobacteria bacterium]|uniref:Segregation and condensation protein A n=1 Tax=Candidatus Thiopontia autotrophica TaxID=2841688 RepID=A0A8J6TNX3_9GAMM|nr:segregation and condensation protein A [Candidatus Thiopontia autotrophica]MBL6969392.1 segregation and condensation protein A [Gammaproteobacteria bacterium]
MESTTLSKEQRILRMVRKTLGAIARETAPQEGKEHPLTKQTFDDMRDCFALVAQREKELLDEAGIKSSMRPTFSDEPNSTKVVSIDSLTNRKK